MGVHPSLAGQVVSATVALLVYTNTIPAGFVFDDYFAVVRNRDVTDHAAPLRLLLHHDFWGQDLSSPQSHKSYRPLTVLFYRLVHGAWVSLPASCLQKVAGWRAVMVSQGIITAEELPPPGLDPLPFHMANILLHALASALVCRLAYHMFNVRVISAMQAALAKHQKLQNSTTRQLLHDPQADSSAQASTSTTGGVQGAGRHRTVGMVCHATSAYELVHLHLPAWLTGVAFAIHPVHTEAVAGVVGAAELLCACAAVPALLCYFASADADCSQSDKHSTIHPLGPTQQQQQQGNAVKTRLTGTAVRCMYAGACQWGYLLVALLLLWVAALCKEIGITIAGCMLAYDLLLAPSSTLDEARLQCTAALWQYEPEQQTPCMLGHTAAVMHHESEQQTEHQPLAMPPAQLPTDQLQQSQQQLLSLQQQQQDHSALRHRKRKTCTSQDVAGSSADHTRQAAAARGSTRHGQDHQQAFGLQRKPQWAKMVRCMLVIFTAAAYVHTRTVLAGDQLVRIYRKVENPIPFATEPLTRTLSTAHLHARYTWLLLWPQHLSADWSYSCIPLVTEWIDPRNAASLLLYTYLALVFVLARPWQLMVNCLNSLIGKATGVQLLPSTWRFVVAVGLLVGPFLPAANLFFYVGTFIGERLLYTPSIGALLLLAEMLSPILVSRLLKLAGYLHASDVMVLEVMPQKLEGSAHAHSSRGQASQPMAPSNQLPNSKAMSSETTAAQDDWLDRTRLVQPASAKPGRHHRFIRAAAQAMLWAVGVAVTYVLVLAAGRTWLRNWDWLSEETLFVAAQKVCPNSAKVALNSGILARRHHKYQDALAHFTAARDIEPGYCEPGYWIGSTLFNLGDVPGAVRELEGALHCKYVAADALSALHSLYQVLQQAGPQDGTAMARWGQLLVQPHVGHLAEGCEVLETAALHVLSLVSKDSSKAGLAVQAVRACAQAITDQLQVTPRSIDDHGHGEKATVLQAIDDGSLAQRTVQLSGDALRQLLWCIQNRAAVYHMIIQHGIESEQARLAMYSYLGTQQQQQGGVSGDWRCQDAARIWLQKQAKMLQQSKARHCSQTSAGKKHMATSEQQAGLQSDQSDQLSAADSWLDGFKWEQEVATASAEPSAHMLLIHRFQSRDADDPWLQLAWARALLQLKGRAADACVHMAAAAMLFQHQAQELVSASNPAAAVGVGWWRGRALDGTRMTLQDLYDAAAVAYMRAVRAVMAVVRAEQISVRGLDVCDLMARGFHARVMTVRLASAAVQAGKQQQQPAEGMAPWHRKFQQEVELLLDVMGELGENVPDVCSVLLQTVQKYAREMVLDTQVQDS